MQRKPAEAPKRPYTEARKNSNIKWDRENIDRLSIALPKGSREKIKAHAERQGESVNRFISRCIDETMQRDQERQNGGSMAK